jgi:hypothetical protein
MLVSEVIARVRQILNDSDAARWPNTTNDAILRERVKDAQNAFLYGTGGRAGRRDFLLNTDGTFSAVPAIVNAATNTLALAVPAEYLEAMAQYVAGRSLAEDNSDTANVQAGMLLVSQALDAVLGPK